MGTYVYPLSFCLRVLDNMSDAFKTDADKLVWLASTCADERVREFVKSLLVFGESKLNTDDGADKDLANWLADIDGIRVENIGDDILTARLTEYVAPPWLAEKERGEA